ncbi:nuclear transport factor 2 family protein [Actinoplanes aureus]|uniref:nuclear transport factor 2 family protein n=1 Tax=Actinoplanes aureus TaxID=2792083 RepID=UPI001E2CE5FC|nr:nuclear transport factor 2 family protein [Actinoplanes aureus]
MRYKIITAIVLAGALLTGCGSSSDSRSSSKSKSSTKNGTSTKKATTKPKAKPKNDAYEELRAAVQAYSDAFLSGDATTAYGLLSDRCRKRTSQEEFTGIVDAAKELYGSPLPFKSYSATISGDLGRVTYTYSIKAINQEKEPWAREAGNWHQDDC